MISTLLYSQTVINQQEHIDGVGRIKLHPPDIVLYFFLVRGEKLLQILYPFYLFLLSFTLFIFFCFPFMLM